MTDELPIITRETQESTKAFNRLRLRPICDCLNLEGVHCHTVARDRVAQIVNRSLPKGTFAKLYPQAMSGQNLKNNLQMGDVSSQ